MQAFLAAQTAPGQTKHEVPVLAAPPVFNGMPATACLQADGPCSGSGSAGGARRGPRHPERERQGGRSVHCPAQRSALLACWGDCLDVLHTGTPPPVPVKNPTTNQRVVVGALPAALPRVLHAPTLRSVSSPLVKCDRAVDPSLPPDLLPSPPPPPLLLPEARIARPLESRRHQPVPVAHERTGRPCSPLATVTSSAVQPPQGSRVLAPSGRKGRGLGLWPRSTEAAAVGCCPVCGLWPA